MKRTRSVMTAVVLLAAAIWAANPTTASGAKPRPPVLDSTKTLHLPAWAPVHTGKWPEQGGYDVRRWPNLAGFIGLEPLALAMIPTLQCANACGEVTFTWWHDAAAQDIAGVQGLPLTSAIVSTDMLNIRNLGPYLTVGFDCYTGDCPLSFRLYGTKRKNNLPEIPGDTILITETGTIEAHTSHTIYPDDYFTGPVRMYLEAPPGFEAKMHGADLLFQWWPLDIVPAGNSLTTFAPFGTWMVVVTNTTSQAGKFTLSVTPDPTAQVDKLVIPGPKNVRHWRNIARGL